MFDFSQARESLLASDDALALGANSWTVETVPKVGKLFECPSIGFPLPFGTQVTNPLKKVRDHNTVLAQIESYGLFPPESVRGTLANCVLPKGQVGIWYAESDITTYLFDVQFEQTTGTYVITPKAEISIATPQVSEKQVNPKAAKADTGN